MISRRSLASAIFVLSLGILLHAQAGTARGTSHTATPSALMLFRPTAKFGVQHASAVAHWDTRSPA